MCHNNCAVFYGPGATITEPKATITKARAPRAIVREATATRSLRSTAAGEQSPLTATRKNPEEQQRASTAKLKNKQLNGTRQNSGCYGKSKTVTCFFLAPSKPSFFTLSNLPCLQGKCPTPNLPLHTIMYFTEY